MEESLRKSYQVVVGKPYGWVGSGNSAWYYTIAIVMGLMLTWWAKPGLGLLFTICAVIHYASVCVYAYSEATDGYDEETEKVAAIYSGTYFALNVLMFLICWAANWYWTLLCIAILGISLMLAPDYDGENRLLTYHIVPDNRLKYWMHKNQYVEKYVDFCGGDYEAIAMFTNTIWFVLFFILTIILPISVLVRLAIIAIFIAVHPLIDLLDEDCATVVDVTREAYDAITYEDTEDDDFDDDDDDIDDDSDDGDIDDEKLDEENEESSEEDDDSESTEEPEDEETDKATDSSDGVEEVKDPEKTE